MVKLVVIRCLIYNLRYIGIVRFLCNCYVKQSTKELSFS